jgi:hypothetical protein
VWSILVSLFLLAPAPAVTYWQFDGQLAFEAQQFVQTEYGDTLAGHLFDDAMLKEHLIKQAAPTTEGDRAQEASSAKSAISTSTQDQLKKCLNLLTQTQSECQLTQLMLSTSGVSKLVYFHIQFKSDQFQARMAVESVSGDIKVYRKRGPKLRPLLRDLIETVFSVARYQISGLPPKSTVWIDEQEMPSKGPYVVSAGSHQVKVSTPQYQDYTTTITLKNGQLLSEKVQLVSALASLHIKILNQAELIDLKVTLDDQAIDLAKLSQELEVKPGKHALTCSAQDRLSITKSFELKPGERGTWEVMLNYDKPLWKIAMRTPHADTQQGDMLVAFRLQAQTLRAGAWRAHVDEFKDPLLAPDKIRAQPQDLGGFGFDVDVSWILDDDWGVGPMRLGLIGIGYERFGRSVVSDRVNIETSALAPINGLYDLSSLNRFKTKLLWPGYQMTLWRITPYFKTGFMWVYEQGDIDTEREDGVISAHSLRWGWELGFDYRLLPEWVIQAAFSGDVSTEQRAALQVMLGAAFALDVF